MVLVSSYFSSKLEPTGRWSKFFAKISETLEFETSLSSAAQVPVFVKGGLTEGEHISELKKLSKY